MILIDLLAGFFRVGCFSFGGAYGAIPLIRDVVLSYGWLTDEELAYMIAVSESTPGPIMVNLATYVGSSQAGFIGAAAATFAVILPSFIVILLIMSVLKNAWKNRYVQAVLKGLKPCVTGIVLATGIYMAVNGVIHNSTAAFFDIKTLLLTVFLGVIMFVPECMIKKKISPVMLIAAGAACGMLIY